MREPANLHEVAVLWYTDKHDDGQDAVWYAELANIASDVGVDSTGGTTRLSIPRAHFQRSASTVVPLALPSGARSVTLSVASGARLPHTWSPASEEVMCAFSDLASEFQVFVTDPDVFPLQIAWGAPAELARPLQAPKHLSFTLAWSDRVRTWDACRLSFVRQGERFFRLWQNSPLDRHVSLRSGVLPLAGSIQGGMPATLVVAEPGLERFGRELADVSNPPEVDWYAENWEDGLVEIEERYLWTRIAVDRHTAKAEPASGWFRIATPDQGSSHWRRFRPPDAWAVRMELPGAYVELLLDSGEYGTAPSGAGSVEVKLQQPRAFVLKASPDLDLSLSGYRVQMAKGARPMDPCPTVLDGTWPENRTVSLQLPRAPGLKLVLCLSDGKTCRFETVPLPDTLEQHTASFSR